MKVEFCSGESCGILGQRLLHYKFGSVKLILLGEESAFRSLVFLASSLAKNIELTGRRQCPALALAVERFSP